MKLGNQIDKDVNDSSLIRRMDENKIERRSLVESTHTHYLENSSTWHGYHFSVWSKTLLALKTPLGKHLSPFAVSVSRYLCI